MSRRNVIIKESQFRSLIHSLTEDRFFSSKIEEIKKTLEKSFVKRIDNAFNSKGYPCKKETIIWIDENGNPLRTISRNELFYYLQDIFKNISTSKGDRDNLIKKAISDF